MGQSTSGGKERGRREDVTEDFLSLQQQLGDWNVDEFVFRTPTAEPIVNVGKLICRAEVGRLAINVITDIASTGQQTATLETFDPAQDRYEAALVDSLSDSGIINLTGRSLMTRSSEEIRARFGKAATAVIEWTVVSGQAGLEFDRIVENRINPDKWVFQFFGRGRGQQHTEFVVKEQVITRSNLGCQTLAGCDLGCGALLTCQAGCEGLQGPTTAIQAQPGCACSGSLVTQPSVAQQLVAQQLVAPSMVAQPMVTQQLIALQQLMAQVPVVTAMQLIGLAPMLAAQTGCARLATRPPERTEHPTHPGPGHGHK